MGDFALDVLCQGSDGSYGDTKGSQATAERGRFMDRPGIQGRMAGSHRSKAVDAPIPQGARKRKSGVPTGNAGEYLCMGELLRREFDAQLADRNTKGYDILVGRPDGQELRKIQIKTVRAQPWYVKQSSFEGELLDQVTIYVLIGKVGSTAPVRYFIARNRDLAGEVSTPGNWKDNAFMSLKSVTHFEDRWEVLLE
jgi:hypothetical protein